MEKLKAYVKYSSVLICVFLFGALLFISLQTDEPAVSVETSAAPVVVIDAGHGGEDGGASDNDVLEKDINLAIALKLRDLLRVSGYEVRMVREKDISVYDSSAQTVREKKVSDMQNRVRMINENPQNILISIHQNKFEQSRYSGAQMFYSANHPQSMKLAESIRKSVTSLLQPENKRELKRDNGSVYILKKAEVPAVIVECGFLSNPDEAAKLKTDAYQSKMAFAIYCGFLNYMHNDGRNENGG